MKNRFFLILFTINLSILNLHGQNKKQQIEILQLKKDSLSNEHQTLIKNNLEYYKKNSFRKNEYSKTKELKEEIINRLNDGIVKKKNELNQLLIESVKYEDSIKELDFSEIDGQVQIKLSSKKFDSLIKNKVPLFLQNFSYKPLKNNYYRSAYYVDYNNEVRKIDIRNKLLLYPI